MRTPILSQKWWMVAAALTVVQGATLHWGIKQLTSKRQPMDSQSRFFLATDLGNPNGNGWDAALSPTLFALPSMEGFSGEAWMRYSPPVSAESSPEEPTQWMAMSSDGFGVSLETLAASVRPPPMRVADLPLTWVDSFPAAGAAAPVSHMRIEGPAAGRLIPAYSNLPLWPSADLLAVTEVQVLVTAQGRVLSAVLANVDSALSIPGVVPGLRLPQVEMFAQDYARGLSFKPLPTTHPTSVLESDSALQWCTLSFHWGILPAAATPSADKAP